jgi:hypothetical protein
MTDLPAPPARRFQWPADYYSGPTPVAVLPRWAAFGCGGLSVLVIAIVTAVGVYLAHGGLNQVMDFAVATTMSEVRGMYTRDVPPAQRRSVDAELARLGKDLRAGNVNVAGLDPLLRAMRDAAEDAKVTPVEARRIEDMARSVVRRPHR